jgi:hypothetical protein
VLDWNSVNEAVHKETTAYGATTNAVIDTLNGAGMIGLKPTLAFKVEWEKLVTYFATWKRWPTWAERAPKTLREGVKQFYEKAMREITTKDFRRGTNIPKCGMRPILFTEQDIRLHAYYEDCGDLKIFMDLVAVGVQRFLDRYLRQDGFQVQSLQTQLLVSGISAMEQNPHGDGDNNYLSAIFSMEEPYPFHYWKGSQSKWLALRLLWDQFGKTYQDGSSTPKTNWTIGEHCVALFTQRTLHSGGRNSLGFYHARTFLVCKPRDAESRRLRGKEDNAPDKEYVLELIPEFESFFLKDVVTRSKQGNYNRK